MLSATFTTCLFSLLYRKFLTPGTQHLFGYEANEPRCFSGGCSELAEGRGMTAPGEQDHQPALESGAQGKVLLGVQTNLTLKTWAGFFVCLVGSFSSDVCTE